jgi:hypothetical protein
VVVTFFAVELIFICPPVHSSRAELGKKNFSRIFFLSKFSYLTVFSNHNGFFFQHDDAIYSLQLHFSLSVYSWCFSFIIKFKLDFSNLPCFFCFILHLNRGLATSSNGMFFSLPKKIRDYSFLSKILQLVDNKSLARLKMNFLYHFWRMRIEYNIYIYTEEFETFTQHIVVL